MEEKFSEMFDMFKKNQERSEQLEQQNFEIQAGQREILNILQNPQHQMRYQVTAEDTPGLSSTPVEDSSASGLKNLTASQLVDFFHENKTEISLIDNPHILLNRLRDKSLIQEDKYQVINKIRDEIERSTAFYTYLEWFEINKTKKIRLFLEAIFKDDIIRRYPTLRQLKDKLLKGACLSESNGGITEDMQLSGSYIPEENEEYDEIEMTDDSVIEAVEETEAIEIQDCDSDGEGTSNARVTSTKKRRTLQSHNAKSSLPKSSDNSAVAETGVIEIKDSDSDGEGTSSTRVTSTKKGRTLQSHNAKSSHPKSSGNKKKVRKDSLSKAAEKLFCENKLPIICKETKGILSKSNLTKKDSRSVLSNGVWFFPADFEILSGYKNSKSWKKSIYIDMERVNKPSDARYGKTKCRRSLFDFFKQIQFNPVRQTVRDSHVQKYQHLF